MKAVAIVDGSGGDFSSNYVLTETSIYSQSIVSHCMSVYLDEEYSPL